MLQQEPVKTKILTDRFLRLLLEGNNIKNILCITFTNAAANEMLTRIKERLKNWFLIPNEELEEDIEKLTGQSPNQKTTTQARKLYDVFLNNIDNLRIHTIHSFCMGILQDISMSAQSIKIIDSSKETEALDYALTKTFQDGQADTLQSIKVISELYEYDRVHEIALNFIREKRKVIKALNHYPDINSTVYKNLGADINLNIEDFITKKVPQQIQYLVELLSNTDEEKITYKIQEQIKAFEFDEYKDIFLTKDGTPRKKLLKKKFQEQYPIESELLFTEQENIYQLSEKIKTQICAKYNSALLTFLLTVFSNYTYRTNQIGLIDYDEIIMKTVAILQSSENAQDFLYKLDMKIDHILIDEAQDTNPLQWDLIQILSEEFFSGQSARNIDRTVFFVGDFKQSIYSFQGAEPESFSKAQQYYSKASNNMQNLSMQTSFRTTKPILDLVNRIFDDSNLKRCITRSKEKINHIPFRTGEGYVEVLPLTELEKDDNSISELFIKKDKEENIKRIHAQNIVLKIKQILDSQRVLYGHKRKVQPQDIMILVRKRSELVHYLIRELKLHNIPVGNLDRIKLDENLIVQDLLSLARFLNLPSDDLNLAGLLRSPIIGITEQELFDIAFQRKDKSLFHALQSKSPEHYEYLNSLLNEDFQLSQIYSKVLEQDGRLQSFLERFGKTASIVINSFIELVLEYEQDNIQSIPKFIRWFENTKPEIKNEFATQNNEIQIMTVHAAKGLQAPIVFLADATPYQERNTDNIFWDDDGSIYFSTGNDNDKIKQVKETQKQKDYQENIRLLYVAITRAEDELYVCGYKTRNLSNEDWYDIIDKNIDDTLEKPQDIIELEERNIVHKKLSEKPDCFDIPIEPFEQKKEVIQSFNNKAIERGTIIHNLLYLLPQINDHKTFLSGYIKNNINKSFNSAELEEMIDLALTTIKNFPELFYSSKTQIKSEIPAILEENGKSISIQIDKLIIDNDSIKIIDFKTGRSFPEF